MPEWAEELGNLSPIAHFTTRRVRGDAERRERERDRVGTRDVIELDELMAASFLDTGSITVKCMMKLMGLIPTDEHRLPMAPAARESERRLEGVVERYRLSAWQEN